MDLKGFTTVDEVGGEDSQVREQTAPSDTFKPATASEEIDYINKILADIEEKTGDSDTDSTCVAADAICNVQELDSKSPDQQPTDDALTQAGEFNNVTRSREIASVQHGLSAEPIRVSSQLSVAELDSTQNHISQGTDHDERTCPVLTNPTSELSPGIEDTTSLAVSTDNGDENKLEPRHYSVKYISNPCVSGEEFREVKEDEQVVSCNNIVLGNISDLLADSIETLGDPNLIERDKGDKGEPLLTECPQETCIEADKPKSTKEQLDLNKDSGKFSVNEQPLDPEKTTISDSSLNEATGVIVKKEPEDSMQEDFDFGNVLFDPAEEFNVKEERIKEEPMDPIQDMPFDTIPNDLPCGPLLEDLPVDLPEQNELIDPNHVKLEPSVDSMLVTPSVHFIVEDKHYSREQVTAALLMSRSSFASAVDMDMFEENVVKTMLKIRALPLEVLLKNVKLAPQEDTDVLNKFIVDNSNIIFDNQHNLCLKLLITKASETGKYSKRTPQSKTSTKRPYTKKKRQGKNSTQRHLFTTKESLLSNSVDSKSSEKFEKRNPKTIKENGDSESEYIHIGTVKQLKKEKRKCKDSSKVGQNKKSVKESTIVKSVDFNHDCKPCSVALVDLIKSKKYQEVVREYLDTIKIKSVQLPEKLEMVEEPKLNTELDIASNVNNECKAATDAFVESDHDSNSIDEVDSSKVSGESIDIKDSKEQAVQNDKLLNGKERVLEIITECKELKREEDASDKDIENSKEEEIKQNLNELTAVFVEKEVKEKKVAQVIEKTPSLCKDAEIAEEQKKKKKKDVLQELEKRRSKHEKKRSKREEIVESKEEKARRLSLELGQIFKKDKEKKEKMNEEILSNKSSKEKKRTNSTESTTEDKGRSPSGEDAVLTSVFSRPKLKTFKIPRKKNVEVAKVVEQKSVLASREDQFTFKRTSGYAARTPVQVESSRWKKSKDSDTVGYKKQRRSDVNWYKDRTPSEGRGRSNSPQEQRRSEVNWYKDRTPSEGRGRSNSPQDQRRSEGNLYKDCTPSEGRGRSISPRDQGRGEMNLYKEDVPSERRGRSNSPQDHGLEEDMLDCPSPDSPDQTHDNEGEGHIIQGTNVDKHCQQWVHANSTEEQVPPPPPEIECWEKLAELLNAVKNSTIDKINTSRSTSQDSLVSVGCSQDLATEHIQLEGTREDKTLTKTSDKNKFNADEITGNTEIISTPKSQSTGIEHRHVIASVDTEEIEGSSKMLSYLEGLVLDEYNVNCKDIESRFVHLTKKQKIKLYEKKKKTYYETKKKYHNEKGDVENNERKQMRFKEYQRRRKDYYEMKLFLYEEKKREKKAAEEKLKPCAQLAKEVIDVENEVGEKYKANSVIGSEELVVDLTENNSVKVNAVMSDANNAEIINESEEKKVCESEEPDPKKQEDEGAVIHISQEVKDVIEASVPALLPPPLPPSELIAFAPLPVQSFPERSENEENSDMDLDSDMDIATSDLSDEDDNKDDEMSLLARFGVDISNLEDGGRSNVQLNLDETRDSNNISSLKNIVHKLMTCERQITPRTVNAIEIMDNIPKLIDITQSPDVPTVARMYTPNIPFKNVTERNISETDLNYTSVAEKTSGISTPEIAKACLRTHTPDFPKSNKIHTPDLAKLNVRVQPPDLARMGRLHTPDLVKNDVRILSPTSKTRMHTPDRVTDNNCPVNSSPEAMISEGISSLMKNFAERSHSNQKCSLKDTVNLVEDKEKADDAVQKSSERQSKWTPKPFLPLEDLPDLEHGLDESNDLEVVYSKITNPTQKRGSQWDALPSCYQEIPLAQGVVDNYKDMPLLGLQYVLEVRKGMNATLDKCFFICSLCSKKMTSDTLVAHVNSVPHKLKFSASHCKHVYDKYSKIELKEWTASSVKDLTLDMKKVEDKYGRKRMAVTTERDMSSVLMALKKKISEAAALSQADHEENVDKQKAYRAAQEIRPAKIAQETAKAPIMPAIPVVPEEIPLPPVAPIIDLASIPTPPNTLADKMKNSIGKVTNPANGRAMASVMRNNSNSTESQEETEEYDVVLIRDQGNKFAKRQYNPGPNLRHRSPVRSVSPKRRRSRSPSPRRMYSPKRSRSPDLRRTRSRSRSRSRSSRRSPRRWSPRWSPRRSPRRSPKRSPRRSPRRSPYRSPRRTSNRMRSPGTRHRSRSRERNRQRGRSWSSNSSSSSSSKSHSRGSSSRRRTDNRWQHQHRRKDRHSSSPSRHREDRDSKLTEFREAEAKLIAMHKEYQRMYDLRPHTHPDYNREWQRFWDKRSLELQASGVNPKTYDFKSEWATFWLARMKELDTINFKTNRDALLWKFKIKDPGPIEAGIAEGWEISKPAATRGGGDRSPSPWEDERLARNPSPTPEGSNPSNPNTEMELKVQQPETPSLSDKKLEDEFSVIGTLRMLNELEEQLGSFGPAIATLLEKAIDASQQGGNPVELFKDPDNLVLVRYAREKLVSQISAGILGTTAYMRSMVAVERAMWLQSQAEKLTQQVKYLGLDIPTIARATQGMDRVQIAQYIAQYLLQVGKSDATEEELQNIIVAVSTNHAKLLNEQSSKLTQVQGGNVNVAKTPAETPTSVTSSPGSAIQPTAPQTPVLFPSGASCQERPLHEEKKEEGSPASKKSGENGGLAILQSAYVEEEKPRDMGKLSLEDLQALLSNFRTLSSEEQQALTAYLKKLEATDSKKVTMLREKMQKSNKNAVKSISKVTPKVQGVEKPSSLTNSSKPHVIPDQSSTRAQTPNQPPANEQTQNRLTPTNEPQAPSQPQANPQSQNQLTNHPGTVDQQMNTVNSPHLSSRPPSVNPAPGSNDSELRNDTTNSALSPSATQEPRPPSGMGDTRHNPPSMSSQMDFPRGPGSRPPYDDRPPFDDRGSYEDRPPYESRTPYDARLPFEEDRFRAYPESHNPHEPLRPETSYQDRGGFSQNRPPAPYQREYGNQRPDGPNPWWNHGGNRDSRDQRDFRDSVDNHWGNFNNPSNQNFYRNPGNPDPYGGPNVQQSFGRQGPAVNRGGGPYRGQFRGGDGNRFRGGGHQHPHFQDRW